MHRRIFEAGILLIIAIAIVVGLKAVTSPLPADDNDRVAVWVGSFGHQAIYQRAKTEGPAQEQLAWGEGGSQQIYLMIDDRYFAQDVHGNRSSITQEQLPSVVYEAWESGRRTARQRWPELFTTPAISASPSR